MKTRNQFQALGANPLLYLCHQSFLSLAHNTSFNSQWQSKSQRDFVLGFKAKEGKKYSRGLEKKKEGARKKEGNCETTLQVSKGIMPMRRAERAIPVPQKEVEKCARKEKRGRQCIVCALLVFVVPLIKKSVSLLIVGLIPVGPLSVFFCPLRHPRIPLSRNLMSQQRLSWRRLLERRTLRFWVWTRPLETCMLPAARGAMVCFMLYRSILGCCSPLNFTFPG